MAKERPIVFNAESVRAILEGRKTQTRRVVKPQPIRPSANCHPHNKARHPEPYFDAYCSEPKTASNPRGMGVNWCWWQVDDRQCLPTIRCPFGKPGDRLWVKETWGCEVEVVAGFDSSGPNSGVRKKRGTQVFRADADAPEHMCWRSPRFMPRWCSRLLLEITEIRVERVQTISINDAVAEGVERPRRKIRQHDAITGVVAEFRSRWNTLNAKRGYPWESNPLVWVVSFKRVERESPNA